MSLTNALSNAATGMSAASRRAEVTAHNISNATTEGYARQSVEMVQNVTAGMGRGVRVEEPVRNTDPRLTAARRDAETQAGGSQVEASAARAIADTFSGAGSLFETVAALESSLRGVTEAPESTALHERVVSNAGQVVAAFETVSDAIQTERTEADRSIALAVSEVNSALAEIETLNVQISLSKVSGGSSAALEQLRDDQIDVVAQNIPIRTMNRDNGQLAILTDKGVTLLDGQAKELEFSRISFVTADMDYRAGGSPLSGLTIDGVDISPEAGSQSSSTGKIASLFETRDGTLIDTIAEVDAVAADLVDRFEAAGLAGADGRGIFTEDGAALSAPYTPGLAGRLALNERIDPDQGGQAWRIRDGLDAATQGSPANASLAQSFLDAITEPRLSGGSLSGSLSAAGLAADLGSLFEQRSQTLENIAASDMTRLSTVKSEETNLIGVDIDQELQSLILIEQAYGANAKVIEVADRLVQRLLEI